MTTENETWGESEDFTPDYSLDPWHDPDPTPILFLDVDGVVNALPHGTPPQRLLYGDANPGEGYQRSYRICWNPEIMARLQDLHDSGRVRIHWLTTWGRGANGELRELVGLSEFPVAKHPTEEDTESYGALWWKLDVVKLFHWNNPDRKYIWCDDELRWSRYAKEWAEGKDVLLVGPWENKGLDHEWLNRIETFLEE